MPEAALSDKPLPLGRRFRAPREDGSLLAVPSLSSIAESARGNQKLLSMSRIDVQGRSLQQLRDWTRQTVSEAAVRYTSELSGTASIAPIGSGLLFVGGHQPSLFHPGVWVKNFALGRFARETGGSSLHLIVDNDTVASSSIRVPQGTRETPRIERIAYDSPRPMQPWEDADVLDEDLFRSFGGRVAEAMRAWGIEPLAQTFWPDAVAHLECSRRLADCLCAARHRLERSWGLENLELPLSRLCQLEPFLWFASHLFAHAPRFRSVYNDVLRQYRQVNRVRSRTHPVPELTENDGWTEAPFWIWSEGETRRHRVFCRQRGRNVELSDGTSVLAELPLTAEGEACCAVEVLRTLSERGIRLRTRALTTTLFARLCLADLFVHGIGGAKYDEMSDSILMRFFGLQPPQFMALSATVHLPLGGAHPVTEVDAVRLRTLLRDLEFNPDRHLAGAADEALVSEKRQLVGEQHRAARERTGMTRSERRARHRMNHARHVRLGEINSQLAKLAAVQRRRIETELEQVERELAANCLLQDREYQFALYPESRLRPFMTGVLEGGG